MSLLSMIGFKGSTNGKTIPVIEIFPFPLEESFFIQKDIETIYKRILTECLERTSGIDDKYQHLLWDNVSGSELPHGLVTLIASAMYAQKSLYVIHKKSTNVIRLADSDEEKQIQEDYEKNGKSSLGVLIRFDKFELSKLLKVYSMLEYHATSGLFKGANISKALQFKVAGLRSSVGTVDSDKAIEQAQMIVEALSKGKDAMIDGQDKLETTDIDTEPTNKVMEFVNAKRSHYLGLPISWFEGESKSGLGDTGDKDSKAIERGLKPYYYSIVKPTLESLFGVKTSFRTEDHYGISVALDMLRTFDLIGDEYLNQEQKRDLIGKAFALNKE